MEGMNYVNSLQDYKRNQKTVPAEGTVFWLLDNGKCSCTLNSTMNRLGLCRSILLRNTILIEK